MTPEGERLARAVRTTQALQTARRHLEVALRTIRDQELEAANELMQAREAVHQAEAKKRDSVPA